MKGAVPGALLVLTLVSSASGWGYIFSKFRPEASSNWGSYGGAGLSGPPERLSPREQLMEALLGEEFLEEEVCRGRRCTSNEHCCPGHLCVDVDSATGGSCMAVGSRRLSPDCGSDLDCAEGHVCEMGACAAPPADRKGYSEVCMVSSECDFSRGLCCQFIRRHRQAPRKMCSYFKDPLSCIGHIESEAKQSRSTQ